MSGVGKKLEFLHKGMLNAYRYAKDKEAGARAALELYHKNADVVEDLTRILADIRDLKDTFEESLRVLAEERSAEEKRSRTIRGSGSLVSKLVPCGKNCRGCPHGPYLYKVTSENGRRVWKYLGKAR